MKHPESPVCSTYREYGVCVQLLFQRDYLFIRVQNQNLEKRTITVSFKLFLLFRKNLHIQKMMELAIILDFRCSPLFRIGDLRFYELRHS